MRKYNLPFEKPLNIETHFTFIINSSHTIIIEGVESLTPYRNIFTYTFYNNNIRLQMIHL
jgi:hypothetical protein